MDLRQKTISGVKWSSLLSLGAAGLQFATMIALARLLTPAEYGLVGMTTMVVGFAVTFADFGVSNAVIHRQEVSGEELSSLFWLNVLVGGVLFALVSGVNSLITAFFREPLLAGPLFLSGFVFVLAPWGQLSQTLLQKELRFRRLAVIQLLGAAVNAVLSVSLAFCGKGAYSIIIGQLAATAVQSILFYFGTRGTWRLQWFCSPSRVGSFLSFGLYQMGERMMNFLNSNFDYMLIGSLLGAKELGYYTLAYNLVLKPSQVINPILTRVAFPVLARVQHESSRLRHGYLKMLRYVASLNAPVMAGLAATVPLAFPLLGTQWLPAVPLVQILCVVGLLRAICNPVGALLMAKGRADLGFRWNASLMVTQIPGLYLGARWGGSVGVAVAFAVLMVCYAAAMYPALIVQLLGPCRREYVASIVPSLWQSALMGLGVFLVGYALPPFSNALVLGVQVALGVVVYLALVYLVDRAMLDELRGILRGGGKTLAGAASGAEGDCTLP
ncbi:MOP flippase family protein [Geomesophilobacter sediminis]|uniref:MOP flippase family protein n=1 Tax=Geomesophilobacter sediminis TaxID=2798584 RepID=A0A8J7J130_9BACT|nr:MOP flippase family protein [Geomesophilobacter sediminis]MBJ6724273.1 MOP flippase family protein [Geomesophilobacter sediminis]